MLLAGRPPREALACSFVNVYVRRTRTCWQGKRDRFYVLCHGASIPSTTRKLGCIGRQRSIKAELSNAFCCVFTLLERLVPLLITCTLSVKKFCILYKVWK